MSYSYSDPPNCCSAASGELKLYQAFIFSVPIFFTFILLFLFYLFYLRRRRVDWSSLRMRASYQNREANSRLSESGLKKELREMLPIIVFKESFSIRDTQCSVCLGDYQAEDRLQQIPACGHTFHMDCIDHWLATHTTCPLCRLSLLPAAKTQTEPSSDQTETQADGVQINQGFPEGGNWDEQSHRSGLQSERGEGRNPQCEEESTDTRKQVGGCGCSSEGSVVVDIATSCTAVSMEHEDMGEDQLP